MVQVGGIYGHHLHLQAQSFGSAIGDAIHLHLGGGQRVERRVKGRDGVSGLVEFVATALSGQFPYRALVDYFNALGQCVFVMGKTDFAARRGCHPDGQLHLLADKNIHGVHMHADGHTLSPCAVGKGCEQQAAEEQDCLSEAMVCEGLSQGVCQCCHPIRGLFVGE